MSTTPTLNWTAVLRSLWWGDPGERTGDAVAAIHFMRLAPSFVEEALADPVGLSRVAEPGGPDAAAWQELIEIVLRRVLVLTPAIDSPEDRAFADQFVVALLTGRESLLDAVLRFLWSDGAPSQQFRALLDCSGIDYRILAPELAPVVVQQYRDPLRNVCSIEAAMRASSAGLMNYFAAWTASRRSRPATPWPEVLHDLLLDLFVDPPQLRAVVDVVGANMSNNILWNQPLATLVIAVRGEVEKTECVPLLLDAIGQRYPQQASRISSVRDAWLANG